MRAALEGESPEREPKAQAAVGQSPSPSKVKADAPLLLDRAPISKLATEPPPAAAQLAGLALSFQKLPPAAPLLVGQAHSFQKLPPMAKSLSRMVQSFQEVDSDLAKKQQEMQAKEKAATGKKMSKKEKEEQFRQSMEDGAFKTWEGKDHLIKCFKTILDRHRKRETMRNRILLGSVPLNPKVHSKCYDQHTAEIRDGCMEENTF